MDKETYQKHLKELYFKNQKNNKQKEYSSFKTSSDILKSLVRNNNMSKVKERAYIDLILKKILLVSHYNWISYAYTKNEKLIIFAKNHIGQTELNYQKDFILKSFCTIEKYKHLQIVSILRDTNRYKNNLPLFKKSTFKEKSFGIFDNFITNQRLSKIIESIRTEVKKNNS